MAEYTPKQPFAYAITGSACVSGMKVSFLDTMTGVAGSGYYAGPLSVPHQYQSPTKYRTCSYCRSQAEIGKNCQNCGAPEIKERGRLIYD